MRKAVIIAALILTAVSAAQDRAVTVHTRQDLDAPNALRGGKTLGNGEQRNSASINYRGELMLRWRWLEFGGTFEAFPTIDYYAAGIRVGTPITIAEDVEIFIFGDYFELGDIRVTPAIEAMLTDRSGLDNTNIPGNREKATYVNHRYALTFGLEEIGGSAFGFNIEPALLWRGDIREIWGAEALPGNYLQQLWDGKGLYLSLHVNLTKLLSKR